MIGDRDTGAYHEVFEGLTGIYLEDSWVLDITQPHNALSFILDAVLTPVHPAYQAPKAGEQYCYRLAQLDISGASPITLRRSGLPPVVGPAGEPDYGNIDCFRAIPGQPPRLWELSGEWGEAVVRDPQVRLRLEQRRPPGTDRG